MFIHLLHVTSYFGSCYCCSCSSVCWLIVYTTHAQIGSGCLLVYLLSFELTELDIVGQWVCTGKFESVAQWLGSLCTGGALYHPQLDRQRPARGVYTAVDVNKNSEPNQE